MGIKGLFKVITNNTQFSIEEKDISSYYGKIIAIDASLLLYKFIIAVRKNGYDIVNKYGEITSHLYAIFIKTLKFLQYGIKPVYVFDGKPTNLKKNVIEYRRKTKEIYKQKLLDNNLNNDDKIKYFKRTVEINKKQINECKQLLQMLNVPYVDSPGEADAQCAALAKYGKVWGVCTEDMDILTFGSPNILRNLISNNNNKITQINLDKIKNELDISYEQFIDLCILLGCDYCDTISGIGQKTALTMIKEHGNITNIINKINTNEIKYKLPINFPYNEIIDYFKNPNIINPDNIELKWDLPNKKNVINFLCNKNGYNYYKIMHKLKLYETYYNKINIEMIH